MKKIGIGAGLLILLCMAGGICFFSVDYANKYSYTNAYSYEGFSYILGGGRVKLYNTKEFDVKDIEKVKVDYRSQNIAFYKGEEGKIVIKEYLIETRKDAEAVMEAADGTLYVNGGKSADIIHLFAFNTQSERIEVYLPESYVGVVEASTSSGNIKLEYDFKFDEFEASANSGNISCESIAAEEIKAETTSGNIYFGMAQGNRVMSASSGNITVQGGDGDTSVKTSSGNINVEDAAGVFRASANSGNISASFAEVVNEIKAETTSGNIKIELPLDSAFSLEASASSGSIRTDFDELLDFNERRNKAKGDYGVNPAAVIRTNASSGSTSIKFQ